MAPVEVMLTELLRVPSTMVGCFTRSACAQHEALLHLLWAVGCLAFQPWAGRNAFSNAYIRFMCPLEATSSSDPQQPATCQAMS